MMTRWVTAFSVVILLSSSAFPAEDGKQTDRSKDPPQTDTKNDSKKSQEPDNKSEPRTEPTDKPADKPAKAEEPAPPKQDEPSKKAVTSPNLTVKLALLADPALFPFEIEVEMDHRKAVLTGTVASEEDKARAADVAKAVEGVEAVTNKLTVSPPIRTAITKKQDETIAHFVRERLMKSETLKAVGFEVKSENGIVHLSGKTRFQVIAMEAAEAARQIPGVRAVSTAGVQIIGKD